MVNLETAQYVECKVAEIWCEDDAVFVKFRHGSNVTISDLQEMNETTRKINIEKSARILTDLRGMKTITREARTYVASDDSPFKDKIAASALLASNLISTIIGNFVIRVDQPPYPTKLFTNSHDAEKWLQKFKPKMQLGK